MKAEQHTQRLADLRAQLEAGTITQEDHDAQVQKANAELTQSIQANAMHEVATANNRAKVAEIFHSIYGEDGFKTNPADAKAFYALVDTAMRNGNQNNPNFVANVYSNPEAFKEFIEQEVGTYFRGRAEAVTDEVPKMSPEDKAKTKAKAELSAAQKEEAKLVPSDKTNPINDDGGGSIGLEGLGEFSEDQLKSFNKLLPSTETGVLSQADLVKAIPVIKKLEEDMNVSPEKSVFQPLQ